MSPRTVAVTGATGFIGPHVVRRLSGDGWRVRVLTRRSPPPDAALLAGPSVEAVQGSLDDPSALRRLVRGVDAVVHVAGMVKARSRAEFFRVNADGVARLVEAAAAEPPAPRFVLISSLAAREPGLSAYAASKRAGETALIESGAALPSWTVLRPPVVYGPGDRQTLAFFRWVSRGIGPVLGPEGARVSLLHVDDLAALVAAVLDEGGEAVRGLIGEPDDGQPGGHTWPALVAAAAGCFGRRARVLRVPRTALQAAGLANRLLCLFPGFRPMLTPDKVREVRHPDWVCDARPLIERTAWRPRTPIGPGFAGTIAWYRRHGWL